MSLGSSIQIEHSGHLVDVKNANSGRIYKLKRHERKLLHKLENTSSPWDWASVQSFLATYNGTSQPLYAAAIQAAFRCGQYSDGALIFDRCKKNFPITYTPLFSAALKVLGKCGAQERVHAVWQEALRNDFGLDKGLALARISAAADAFDVETAARVLDQMVAANVSVEVFHLTSAIRSCGPKLHQAARYFFDLMPHYGIQPNVIAFSSLMRAYTTAPLKDILQAYEEMKRLNIKPNDVFAEVYLGAVLQGLHVPHSQSLLLNGLQDIPVERIRAAQAALYDFEERGLKLTVLAKRVKHAFKQLAF